MVLGSHLDLPKGAHGVHHLVMHHIAEDGDPVAYGQKTAVRRLFVY